MKSTHALSLRLVIAGATIGLVGLLAPSHLLPPPGTAGAQAEPPELRLCHVQLDKLAEPGAIRLGQAVHIQMRFRANCTDAVRPVSLVYVIDRSSWAGTPGISMTDAERLAKMVAGVTRMNDAAIDFSTSAVGVVTYDDRALALQALSGDRDAINEKLRQVRAGSSTRDPAAALDRARTMLSSRGGDRVVVLVGGNTAVDKDALKRSAVRLQSDGTELIVMQVQTTAPEVGDTYTALVPPERHYVLTFDELSLPVEPFRREVLGLGIVSVTIDEELAPALEGVPGSAVPPPGTADGRHFRWPLVQATARVPREGIPTVDKSVAFDARGVQAGLSATSTSSYAEIDFTNWVKARVPFPIAELDIVPPRPTQTPTATPAATTPRPEPTVTPTAGEPTATESPPSETTTPLPIRWVQYIPIAYRP